MTRYPSVMTPPINPAPVAQGGGNPMVPASSGWGDSLKQILPMLPALLSSAGGNKEALAAFMESYQKTQAMLEGQGRERDELTMRREDRDQLLQRQAEQDRLDAEDRARRHAMENVSIGPKLAEAGAMMDSPQGAESAIDALYQQLQGGGLFGDLSGSRDAAIQQATQTITAKQKRQMGEFVEAALKVEYVANNPEADPELTVLPEHIAKMIGKPSARLSELQQFAQLPVGKPAKAPVRDPIDEYRQRKMIDREFDAPARDPLADYEARKRIDQKYEKPAAAAPVVSDYSAERAYRTVQSVDELMGKVSRWTTGMGSMLSGIPESAARNFAAELDTLKANIAFNELTAMREASKTGGALGQVSDKEAALLQSALGALDSGQSPANIKAQLQKIKASVQRWQQAKQTQPLPNGATVTLPPPSGGKVRMRFDAQGNPIP